MIFTAHRPADVAVDIRAIATFWMIFRITQEHDLKVIGDHCGSKVVEQVLLLNDGELIIWNDSRATWRKESDRRKWYVPMAVQIEQREAINQ